MRTRSVAYNCDCVTGMRKLDANTIDLTVTSPPYDSLRTYNGFVFDWKSTLDELYRITKPGGVVVWIIADQTQNGSETGSSFRQALYAMEIGFNLHDTMIWEKDSTAFPEQNRYEQIFEYMFIFSKGKPKTFNPIRDRKNKWGGGHRFTARSETRTGLSQTVRKRGKALYAIYMGSGAMCGKSRQKRTTAPGILRYSRTR